MSSDKQDLIVDALLALRMQLAELKSLKPAEKDSRVSFTLKKIPNTLKVMKDSLGSVEHPSYEFYEETAQIVSLVSSFRVDLPWEAFFQEQQIWSLLNTLVNLLAEVVYQQAPVVSQAAMMGIPIDWYQVPVLKLQNWLEAMDEAAGQARQEADEAVAASEHFLGAMSEVSENLKQTDQLMQSTIAVTQTLYIKNAAAAIATDRAIAARQYFIYKASLL